jgi:molybdopterin biosynthesis enzyme
MSKANGLAVIDEDCKHVKQGEEVPVIVLDHHLGMSASPGF